MTDFMFATGIENSYPTIAGGRRVDEMEVCGHYKRWREDLRLTKDLGIDYLRIGPAYYLIHEAPGRYRWDLFDDIASEMKELGIEPIIDLLHFGVPGWIGDFQSGEFARRFADYAGAFAERYNHIRMYTPVNEILICARFSALYGWWNEMRTDKASYCRALMNLVEANLLAMRAVRSVREDAQFVQTESFEYWHAAHPNAQERAAVENVLRFLPLDLSFQVEPDPLATDYLLAGGVSAREIENAQGLSMRDGCMIGIDYYITSEQVIAADGQAKGAGEVLGLAELAAQYYERYRLPMMHTETNMSAQRAVAWLDRQWLATRKLIDSGIPMTGFTWFSLTDQMDWDKALRDPSGFVCTIGLADLERRVRPVGERYREIIKTWRSAPGGRMEDAAKPLAAASTERSA